MIYDVFTFNGEYDLLEIRLNILNDYVDQFIIVEATETFSGKPKPLYYEMKSNLYANWAHKIKYHVVTSPYEAGIVTMAHGSPNTNGADHWKTEFAQKESIKQALSHLQDDDICFIGDVDEIWNPQKFKDSIPCPLKLRLDVYTYYLNNRSSEEFWGTFVCKYKDVKNRCLNHLRSATHIRSQGVGDQYLGWHFTSMGGYNEVARKLSDSYTRESYWTPQVQNNLALNIDNSRDFLGRNFTYTVDESQWPQYLKDNKAKYIHLCKP